MKNILIFVFFIFGWLLLNDAVIGDGAVDAYWIQTNNWKMLSQGWELTGYYTTPYVYKIPTIFEDFIFGFKLLNFCCIVLLVYALFKLIQSLNLFSKSVSILLICLTISYPVFNFWSESIDFTLFVVCFTAFYTSMYFYQLFRHTGRWPILVLFLICWLFSLQIGSLLTYSYAIFLGFSMVDYYKGMVKSVSVTVFIRQYHFFLLIPILFYLVSRHFLGPQQEFEYYNSIGFLFDNLIRETYKSGYNMAIEPFLDAAAFWIEDLIGALSIAVFTLSIVLVTFSRIKSWNFSNIPIHGMLIWSSIAFVLALVPYLAVGKGVGHFQDSRFALLLGLPVAVFIVGFVKLIFRGKDRLIRYTLLFILWFYCFHVVKDFVLWQNRGVKMNAIITELRKIPESEFQPIILYIDHTDWGMSMPFHIQELNYLTFSAWGNTMHCGQELSAYRHQNALDRNQINWVVQSTLEKSRKFGKYLIMEDFIDFEPDHVSVVNIKPNMEIGQVELFVLYNISKVLNNLEFNDQLVSLVNTTIQINDSNSE